MVEKLNAPDINFHIGAPGIASDIIKDLAKNDVVRRDTHTRVLRAEEYRRFLRPSVNASNSIMDMVAGELSKQDEFWKKMSNYEVLAASQHAMLGHPKQVIRDGVILPDASSRIERLVDIFKDRKIDLHITVTRQSAYVSSLPKTALRTESLETATGGLLSWFEFVARLQQSCPETQFLVWDFSDPEKVALPFAMALLHFEEDMAWKLKPIVTNTVAFGEVFAKIFDAYAPSVEICQVLDEQFELDMANIAQLPNTVVIRSAAVPPEFHTKPTADT